VRLYVVTSVGPLLGETDPEVHSEVYYDRVLAAATWRDWAVEDEPNPGVRAEVERLMSAFTADDGQWRLLWIDPGESPWIHAVTSSEVPNLRLVWAD